MRVRSSTRKPARGRVIARGGERTRRPPGSHGPRRWPAPRRPAILACVDLLVTDPVTGKQTGLDRSARAALNALRAARVPFSVIGATALAVRGFPRMTRDLDVVVGIED